MPVFRVNKMYKKLITTPKVMLLLDKRTKLVRKLKHTDREYKTYLNKPDVFYTLRLVE